MIDPRPLTPVSEAQLLLTRHEPWTTDVGAYLESEDVLILIESEQATSPSTDAVDVLITLRSHRRPAALHDIPIELVATDGQTVAGRVGPRGQARFRDLPSGSWRTRLGAAASTVDTDASQDSAPDALVVPFRRISRVLADAAASQARQVRDALRSADQQVITEVEETDEGRLVATITTPRAGLVRLRWALVDPSSGSEVRTLITPLAQRGPDGEGIAKYDLGPVVEASAIDLAPAEWASPSELDERAVRAAFDLVLYGSAVRAWEEFAESEQCPGHLRAIIHESLGQQ